MSSTPSVSVMGTPGKGGWITSDEEEKQITRHLLRAPHPLSRMKRPLGAKLSPSNRIIPSALLAD